MDSVLDLESEGQDSWLAHFIVEKLTSVLLYTARSDYGLWRSQINGPIEIYKFLRRPWKTQHTPYKNGSQTLV